MKMTSCFAVVCLLVAASLSVSQADSSSGENCPDLLEDVKVCEGYMTDVISSQDLSRVCQAGRQFVECVEDIQDRCAGHPALPSLQSTLDYLKDYMDSHFNCSQVEGGASAASVESAENGDNVQCPPSIDAFNMAIYQCLQPVIESPSPDQMCNLLRNALSCVSGLVDACQGSAWMTAEFSRSIQDNLENLRAVGQANGCPGL